MSGEWLGLSQSRVVWSKLGPVHRCGSWHSVNTRIEDTQLVTEVDLWVQFWKAPQIPMVHRRVPPSKCLRNWLLSTGGLLFRSYPVCSFPAFLLLFSYRVSTVYPALPLVLMPHFPRNIVPDARVQRRGPCCGPCCRATVTGCSFTHLSPTAWWTHQKLSLSHSWPS